MGSLPLPPLWKVVVRKTFLEVETEEVTSPLRREASAPAILSRQRVITEQLVTKSFAHHLDGDCRGFVSTPCRKNVDEGGKTSTTVMLKNIPVQYTSGSFKELLDKQGFKTSYNFVYVAMSFRSGLAFGYAVVNLVDQAAVQDFKAHFAGFTSWGVRTSRVGEVAEWANSQDLVELVDRYRNSPVMHPAVPQDWKPLLLVDGQPVTFPSPTKSIKAPNLKVRASAPHRGKWHSHAGMMPGVPNDARRKPGLLI